jgi:peptidoglycan L-alanyl-D-glutamate endopeptidase CwlK
MPKFSKTSRRRLNECDPRLIKICEEAIKHFDFAVICGHRSKADQDAAVKGGFSKLKWPKSKHNKLPSHAVDLAPFPIDWNNIGRFIHLADIILAEAKKQGVKIRWGADWNRNGKWQDEKFRDWPHFELDEA